MAAKGCTREGVCGKKADLAALQDLLVWVTKGLGAVTTQLRREKKEIPDEVNRCVRVSLCMTQTNTNFDRQAILDRISRTLFLKKELLPLAEHTDDLPEASMWEGTPEEYAAKAETTGVMSVEDTDIRCFRELITYACKGIASMAEQAGRLGMQDADVDIFIQRALGQTLDDKMGCGNLLALTMEAGRYSVRSMDLFHRARIAQFGEPERTNVFCGAKDRPGILVTGTGIRDLYLLLEQTKDCGIDIYTHGEMLYAHACPGLKKYPHFAGQFGGSWQTQKEDFEQFHGPVLATSEGVFLPKPSYKGRLYTTGYAGIPGCVHIPETEDGQKDFSVLIEQAKQSEAPAEREKTVWNAGFSYGELFAEADRIAAGIKDGTISKIAAVIGDDGRARTRSYYTDLVRSLPQDSRLLTAGSIQFRFPEPEDAGTEKAAGTEEKAGAGARFWNSGELADTYSIIQFALRLREVLGADNLNQLPMFWSLSWHGQRSIAVLLGLLYLDIKRIQFGPTWPAFLGGNLRPVFSEYFGMRETGTVQTDLQSVFGASDDLITPDMIIGDIVDQYPSLVPVMAEMGLHCIGCHVSTSETIAQACMTHGLDTISFLQTLNDHLKITAQGQAEHSENAR